MSQRPVRVRLSSHDVDLDQVVDRQAEHKGVVIGFTGTQLGMTPQQQESVREALAAFSLVAAAHHGDCVGADSEFHATCVALNIPVHIHPPRKSDKRAFCEGAVATEEPRDYLDRNHRIVDASQILIAAPNSDQEQIRSGTWATVRYARRAGKRVFLMLTDGRIAIEERAGTP